jgi:antitoxin CptB
LNSDTESARRRRLIFRAWHRGIREADLLIGSFADRHVPHFSSQQLDHFENILTFSDPDLYNWMSGHEAVPPEYKSDVMDLLVAFQFIRPAS